MSLTGSYPVKISAIKDLETPSCDIIRLLSQAEKRKFHKKEVLPLLDFRDQEDRQLPVLFRFRICQTDLFRERRKKIGPKSN